MSKSLLFFFLFIILISNSKAQDESPLFDPENRLLFGNYLFDSGDYLRAIEEFKSYLTFIPNDTVKFKTGLAYSNLGYRFQANDYFKDIFFGSLSNEAMFEYKKSFFIEKEYQLFLDEIEDKDFFPYQYENNLFKLKSYSYLLLNEFNTADYDLTSPFEQSGKEDFNLFYEKLKNPEYKDPLTAGLLSVFPGGGEFYNGNYGDAASYFLTTIASGYSAYVQFNKGSNVWGGLLSALTGFFYASNIYGAVQSADFINVKLKLEINNGIINYLDQNKYFSPEYDF